MIPCVGNLLSDFGLTWTAIVTALLVVGILLAILFVYFMCADSARQNDRDCKHGYEEWLRGQLEELDKLEEKDEV